MASLALMVSLLFMGILIIGPVVRLVNTFLPSIIANLLSIVCIVYGSWWLFMVPTFIRWIGLWPIYCGWVAWKKD